MTQSAVVTSSRTTMNGKKSAVWLALTICLSIIMLIRLGLISRKFDRLLSHFHPEFRVDSAFIPSLNTSTNPAELTATWDMTLLAINSDNKLIVDYYAVQVWLYYERSTEYNAFVLATTILPPFVLNPPRNQTRMSFRLATLRAYVGDEVVKNITEAAAAGRVTTAFGLKVVTEYRLRSVGYPAVLLQRDLLPRVFEEQ
ncbi:hypothetical protein ACLB2K_073328 [Fragaria x ananassa]